MSRKHAPREAPLAVFAANGQRVVALALVLLLPLVFAPRALHPYATPKALLLATGALVLIALQAARIMVRGRLHVLTGWGAFATGGLLVALVAATTVGRWTPISVFGAAGRASGFMTYAAAIAVFVTVARRFGTRHLRTLAWVLIAAAAVVSVVAILQRTAPNVLPFAIVREVEGVNGTLSNSNFASGFIGIVVPLAVWAMLDARKPNARFLLYAALPVCLGGLWAAASLQGWIAGAAGVVPTIAARIPQLSTKYRTKASIGVIGACVAGAAVGIAGLVGLGPMGFLGRDAAFTIRAWYWEAALAMWRDHPLLGVGLDQYISYYRAYRPLGPALSFPLALTADAAHNVPLMMLTGGGLLLAAAYVGFVGFIAWRSFIGFFHTTPEARLLLGGFVGAWTAYLVQSMVSIDVVPLALMHFVVSGAILAIAGTPWREISLPWAMATGASREHRKRAEKLAWVGIAMALIVVGMASGTALRAFQADVAAGRAARQLADGNAAAAISDLQHAVAATPRRWTYWVLLGRAHYGADQLRHAQEAFDEAASLAPRDFDAVLWRARIRALRGDVEGARGAYEKALRVEPFHPALKLEVARFEASEDMVETALQLIDDALRVEPGNSEAVALRQTLVGN